MEGRMNSDLPVQRQLLHSRQVCCNGYARIDGLWEVEGHLTDVRSVDCRSKRGDVLVCAGQTLHGMRLRLIVDPALTIVEAHAVTEHSPHHECRRVADAYAGLKGLTIGPGFLAAAKSRVRGIHGCTHLTELIGPVATTAIQTMIAAREQLSGRAADRNGDQAPPLHLVDSCHAWRQGGEAFRAHATTAAESEGELTVSELA
jgi:hypothetical protein